MNGEQHNRPRTQNYETPPEIFNELDAIFNFNLDVAAEAANHKCEAYFTEQDDGLSCDWIGRIGKDEEASSDSTPDIKGVCWCNPPYKGRFISKFLKKGEAEVEKGNCKSAVFLLPASTDTEWFWNAWQNYHVYLRRGRIQFLVDGQPPAGSPPGGSCLVVMGEDSFDGGSIFCDWAGTKWFRVDRN